MTHERDPQTPDASNDGRGRPALTRRNYLQTASATAAGLSAFATTPTARAESYETITVAAGNTRQFHVGDGETLSNVLVDITASGAAVHFDATANNWEIRDVGVMGPQPDGVTLAHFSVPDASSSALVENFYVGDGVEECPAGTVGVWVDATDADAHRGTLTFRHVNVQGFADNGIYGSGPAVQLGPDTGGEVLIENSYAKNNNISNFRIGTTGSKITGSVVHVTGPGDVCAHPNGTNARGCWVRDGGSNMLIRNCDIKVPDYNAVEIDSGTELTIEDSRIEGNIANDGSLTTSNVSGNPDTTPPDCVPTTPEEAASDTACDGSDGGGGGGTEPDSGTITFHGGDATSEYRFGAGTDVTGQSNVDTSDDDAVYANATASGSVLGGNDSYDYTGGVTFCNVYGGDATVSIDGTTYSPDDLGQLPNTASIDSTDSNNATDYTLSVSEQLEKSTHNSATIDEEDTIANGTAEGTVQGGADSYRFSGEITSFEYSDSGSFVLYVNGEQRDPDSFGSGSTVVDDFEDGDISEYSFDRGSDGASVTTSPTKSGSYALELSGANTEMISTSGLNAYPSAGDTFSYWVRSTAGAEDMNLTYGVQDHENRYFIRVDVPNDDLILFRYENDSATQLASDSSGYTLVEDAWYEIEVQWASDGTHTVTLLDAGGSAIAQVTATDATWTAGGVGYDAYLGVGGTIYVDSVALK